MTFEAISPTAMVIATLRTYTDIPFAAEVARVTGAEQVARGVLEKGGAKLEQSLAHVPFAEARFKSLTARVRKSGVAQVIELAGGLCFRSVALAGSAVRRYLDTDLPGIVAEKRRVLDALPALNQAFQASGAELRALDASRWTDFEAALARLDPDEPVAIVHEGLLGYLDLDEKAVVAGHVRRVLERMGGVWITPDITTAPLLDETAKVSAAADGTMAAVGRSTGRSFRTNAFEDDAHVDRFFAELGLEVRSDPQLDGSFELVSPDRIGMTGGFTPDPPPRVWTISLAKR